ncbi:hypothetical protein EJF18_50068 [Clavispora lusitaniae]|uniref:Uncharacterized protein n=1 Tax=Clavispora lusitaniae TaxID=36911 RepID=A0ACD0WND3_CLALS|nr:hypothetical protein EJF14_50068 [Clavispora lusitaniae]QFZ34514.1 hypothetical protein EJF16_50068 [Clavispora lusitaniae]QFZ40199.1 hypothetical protein EJF15_50068 [Clavispora lusitaniae]QFZ45879.1 hypothetical protein EJF18_50068 [Clavispora lusitaniae]QFZ51541.1 hypothetical protein EJF17_50068 [Clavispora lusitaniae]
MDTPTTHELGTTALQSTNVDFEDQDYSKIYEQLQEKFNNEFAMSQKLFITEKTQRQALYYYKRRNDAILDLLADLEDDDPVNGPSPIDKDRVAHLMSLSPALANTLTPLHQILSSEDPTSITVKESLHTDLPVYEMIPDLANDELDTVEVNPEETDMWIRRNYAHLVISKFKPLEVRGKDVREYIDASSLGAKKKKKTA